ncbi:MAG: dihydrofolate reductase [Eubacteriales bacterium]|nr:dihydrofolate reductase [Eubacteriales bacterium]
MNLIVAVDQNWAIGYQDELQFRVKADHRHFRELTIGHTVILGRKTLQTFPGGIPLKDRQNLILSTHADLKIENAIIFNSVESLISHLKAQGEQAVFVIGGASVYEALLPYCQRAFVTRFLEERPADRYFPNLDLAPNWELIETSPVHLESEIRFQFLIYEQSL